MGSLDDRPQVGGVRRCVDMPDDKPSKADIRAAQAIERPDAVPVIHQEPHHGLAGPFTQGAIVAVGKASVKSVQRSRVAQAL